MTRLVFEYRDPNTALTQVVGGHLPAGLECLGRVGCFWWVSRLSDGAGIIYNTVNIVRR